MSENNNSKLISLIKDWRHKFELDGMRDQHRGELLDQRIKHLKEIEEAKQMERIAVLEAVLQGYQQNPSHQENSPPAPAAERSVPMLQSVVDNFIATYPQQKEAMLRKHRTVLPVFMKIVGDMPVDQLRQAHINSFFVLICKLPPHWSVLSRKLGISLQAIAEMEHEEVLSKHTFDDTYMASVRPFLADSIRDWQDQGFPSSLTTDRIKYSGNREDAEDKQRAFRRNELQRLFEGPEMRSFSHDRLLAHQFWLPLIGLFTGARVNEICQLNPQVDILQDENQIWYFWINEITEADEGIKKSVKTGDERKVPMHHRLIELGLLDYIERIKKAGAKRLFPAWKPKRMRASGVAEVWFRDFLIELNLRDDAKSARLVGMHAFRHTLLTYGALQNPPLNLTGITGHAQNPVGATGASMGYFDMKLIRNLPDLKVTLDQLDYELKFHTPI